MPSKPTLSTVDFSRLMPLVAAPAARATQNVVDQLDEKLARATLVPPQTMRPDVVTMNSQVRVLEQKSGSEMKITIVYPQ